MIDDTQIARLVVDRKLCTKNELDLCKNEQKDLKKKGEDTSLNELLFRHGYITHSQIARLNMAMDEDSMYRPAQQIPGFQVLNKLGQGAMAVVFKAKQLSLDRIVAIKVLPKRLSDNPEFVDRFYKEGCAAARLNHPNIVQAYDVGESSGYHYFVMEYIDGQTIYELLTDDKPIDEQEALRIVLECAQALGHAHGQGFIHRDVKPKNIMLTKQGVVKLADMGLARAVDDYETANAEAGRAYGTPYYISPEQIRGEITIDCRADIYALGATFYHMVAGRVPFNGSSPSSVMQKHLKEALVPPDHLNHKLSAGVGEIIEVMMAKNADERYASIEAVIDDLEAVKNGGAPLQARTRYDNTLLESLASQGERIEETQPDGSASRETGGIPSQLVLVLVAILVISVLCNIVLFVTR